MKIGSIIILLCTLFLFISCRYLPDSVADAISAASLQMSTDGNSMYHRHDVISLNTGELIVSGEVTDPGKVDLSRLYKRDIIMKEVQLTEEGKTVFAGAFRYIGYSLSDLLHPFVLSKKNAEEFRPQIDVYIKVENDLGEYSVFSWSEIFHSHDPHQVLIANEVAPVKPYRKEVEYSVGNTWKLVAANDLFSNRTIENPVRISVHSFDKVQYEINRDLDPLYSESIRIYSDGADEFLIGKQYQEIDRIKYMTSFFGMGMGDHGIQEFEGISLGKILSDSLNLDIGSWIKHGLICFASVDGYRTIYSYSELFNRYDQTQPILAISENPADGGFYRLFFTHDFFADRSVKALKEMYMFLL
jgi:hypothetical protein